MRKFLQEFLDFFRKGDMILLALCLLTTVVGVVIVASTTNYMGSTRFVIIQLLAAVLGVLFDEYILRIGFHIAGMTNTEAFTAYNRVYGH